MTSKSHQCITLEYSWENCFCLANKKNSSVLYKNIVGKRANKDHNCLSRNIWMHWATTTPGPSSSTSSLTRQWSLSWRLPGLWWAEKIIKFSSNEDDGERKQSKYYQTIISLSSNGHQKIIKPHSSMITLMETARIMVCRKNDQIIIKLLLNYHQIIV